MTLEFVPMDVDILGRAGFETHSVMGTVVDRVLVLSSGRIISPALWRRPGTAGTLSAYRPSWNRSGDSAKRRRSKKRAALRCTVRIKKPPLAITCRAGWKIDIKQTIAGPFRVGELSAAKRMLAHHPEAELVEHRSGHHRRWYIRRKSRI